MCSLLQFSRKGSYQEGWVSFAILPSLCTKSALLDACWLLQVQGRAGELAGMEGNYHRWKSYSHSFSFLSLLLEPGRVFWIVHKEVSRRCREAENQERRHWHTVKHALEQKNNYSDISFDACYFHQSHCCTDWIKEKKAFISRSSCLP